MLEGLVQEPNLKRKIIGASWGLPVWISIENYEESHLKLAVIITAAQRHNTPWCSYMRTASHYEIRLHLVYIDVTIY